MFSQIFTILFVMCRMNKNKHSIRSCHIDNKSDCSGFDNRFATNYSDITDLDIIKKRFQQKQWLDILTNDNVSINDKIKLVDFINSLNINKTSNLFKGLEEF